MLAQEHRIHTLDASKNTDVDVRIISATNRDLNQMVQNGKFRLDLYYRLNIVSFHVPPLCRRPKDLCGLLESLSKKYEVQNFMERLYVMEYEDQITWELLEKKYHFMELKEKPHSTRTDILPLKQAVAEFERQYIAETIKKCRSLEEAARLLEIDINMLMRKQQ